MVADAPDLKPVFERLAVFIGTSKLVIHNADFDMPWLLSGLLRHHIKIPDTSVICTLKWARAIGEPQASLGALTRKYGIGHANAHRALADAAATKEIFFIFDNEGKAPRPRAEVSEFVPQTKKIVDRYREYVQA
jgi:DNA polymerase III epsilon subunit-like protein